jgi:hypothetical protein
MTLLTDPVGIPQQLYRDTLEIVWSKGVPGLWTESIFTLGLIFVHVQPPPRESQPLLILRAILLSKVAK